MTQKTISFNLFNDLNSWTEQQLLTGFGELLATFRTLNLSASEALPSGIEADILRRRLQRKVRPEGERQKILNQSYFTISFKYRKVNLHNAAS